MEPSAVRPAEPLIEVPPPRYRRRTRAEQREETRTRLLEAAWDLFRIKGMDATAEEITEHAGFSTTPLYSVFGSKERLFVELYVELTHRTEQRGRDFGPLGVTLHEALTRYLDTVEEMLGDPEYQHQLVLGLQVGVLGTMTDYGDWGKAIAHGHRESMAATLARYADAAGETLPLPEKRLADVILRVVSGCIVTSQGITPAQAIEPARDLIDLLFA